MKVTQKSKKTKGITISLKNLKVYFGLIGLGVCLIILYYCIGIVGFIDFLSNKASEIYPLLPPTTQFIFVGFCMGISFLSCMALIYCLINFLQSILRLLKR